MAGGGIEFEVSAGVYVAVQYCPAGLFQFVVVWRAAGGIAGRYCPFGVSGAVTGGVRRFRPHARGHLYTIRASRTLTVVLPYSPLERALCSRYSGLVMGYEDARCRLFEVKPAEMEICCTDRLITIVQYQATIMDSALDGW